MKNRSGAAAEKSGISKTYLHADAQLGGSRSCWDNQVVTDFSLLVQVLLVNFCHYYSSVFLYSFASLLRSK